jgi:hypothetical protein
MPTALPRAKGLPQTLFWMTCLAIGVLSLTPVDNLPQQVADIWDKAQHAAGFAALTILGRWAYPRAAIPLGLGLLAYGGAIELAQLASGWRQGDILDWLADGTGVALGLVLSAIWLRGSKGRGHNAQ